MTVTHVNEEAMRPPMQPPLRLIKSEDSQANKDITLLRPLNEVLTDGEIGRHIGFIVTHYKEYEEQQKEAAIEAAKKKQTTERPTYSYSRDALAADDADRRTAMATTVLRGFNMLEATVETDFNGVYRQADQRAIQSTGNDEDAKQLRRNMVETMERYVDHPVLRAARSIVEVSVIGGTERRNGQAVILQRAIAEIFDQQGIAPFSPEMPN